MSLSAEDFERGRNAFAEEIARRARRGGPVFSRHGHSSIWHDQYFGFELTPAGVVNCPRALRVGSTMSQLDVVLVASNQNAGKLIIPAGSTITLSLMQGDSENGTFEDVGPTVCVKAPASGMAIAPNERVCRFPIGDFARPWLMVGLEFSGAVTGGTVDCALGYVPR